MKLKTLKISYVSSKIFRVFILLVSLFLVGCGSTIDAAPLPSPSALPSAPPSIRTPTSTPRPSLTATPTPVLSTLVLRWKNALIADVDDVSEIVLRLKDTPGIIDGVGDEQQISILYDPARITPEEIQHTLANMGFQSTVLK